MTRLIAVTVCLVFAHASASAGEISGKILQLNGTDIPQLTGFQVVAQVGGVIVASGQLNTTQAPFNYSINIDNARLNPNDVRVRLVFSAVGRQTVTLDGIPGNVSHDIKVVMPEQRTTYKRCCCWRCRRR